MSDKRSYYACSICGAMFERQGDISEVQHYPRVGSELWWRQVLDRCDELFNALEIYNTLNEHRLKGEKPIPPRVAKNSIVECPGALAPVSKEIYLASRL